MQSYAHCLGIDLWYALYNVQIHYTSYAKYISKRWVENIRILCMGYEGLGYENNMKKVWQPCMFWFGTF